jgi:hypothetical protein
VAGANFHQEHIKLGGFTQYGEDLRDYMNTLSRVVLAVVEGLTGNAPGSFFLRQVWKLKVHPR